MTASVITFANQTGANGGAIARAVADKLHYRYYDWEVISEAATHAGVSPELMAVATAERPPNLFERVMGRLVAGVSPSDDAPTSPASQLPSMLSSADYRQFIEQVVRELASGGESVIVGHAGQVVLKDTPGVIKVLLTSPAQARVSRLAANQGLSLEEAQRTVDESDRSRAEFFRTAFHINWLEAGHYDVALRTNLISADLARDMIVAVAREMP